MSLFFKKKRFKEITKYLHINFFELVLTTPLSLNNNIFFGRSASKNIKAGNEETFSYYLRKKSYLNKYKYWRRRNLKVWLFKGKNTLTY